MAVQNFSDKATEYFFITGQCRKGVGWKNLKKIAKRKLDILHYAHELHDLRSPPGNHLEALQGCWKGWHSIRMNDQWRIVFQWTLKGPESVQILDYHKG